MNALFIPAAALLLVTLSTLIHYEVLRFLNGRLAVIRLQGRWKVVLVIFAAFVAHTLEMTLYGIALYVLVAYGSVGALAGPGGFSLSNCLYFSAETFTSLGFGDIAPVGPIRLLAGVEALNGLLLIGWSASFAYIAMERYWNDAADAEM